MIKDVKVPEISENVEKGDVASILVSVGDQVEQDQGLLELETDKAVVELPAPSAGTIKEILVGEGDSVNVGDTVMKIDTEGEGGDEGEEEAEEAPADSEDVEEKESASDGSDSDDSGEDDDSDDRSGEDTDDTEESDEQEEDDDKAEAEAPKEEKPERDESPKKAEKKPEKKREEPKREEPKRQQADRPAPSAEERRADPAPAGPAVRRLARELGVDLYRVEGSGPRGRIVEDDVKKFAKAMVTRASETIQAGELPDLSKFGPVRRERMSKVRQLTADAMSNANAVVPQVTQFQKADAGNFEAFREQYKKQVERAGAKLTPTAILLKIVAEGLKKFPRFNAALDMQNKEIVFRDYYHLSIAVDTERGLLVPVVKDVDKKDMTQLAKDLGEISQKARDKKISPDDMQGGSFTISNQGSIGGEWFTPVVTPPQVAILGVSRTLIEPRWNGSEFVPTPVLPLTLSYDHRIVDGADAARFLDWICKAIEQPLSIFV